MKRNIKVFLITAVIAVGLLGSYSCVDPENLSTKDAQVGGLLIPTSKALNYVVGNPGPYKVEFFSKQALPVTSIKLYKQFTTSPSYTITKNGEEVEKDTTFVSNEVLAKTITLTDEPYQYASATFTYTELLDGLTIANLDGDTGPISSDDGDLLIGDNWKLRVVAVLSDGREIAQAFTVGVTVSTRYAGTYKVVSSEYWRIDVPRPDVAWPSEMIIESVNATTYKQSGYFGPFDSSASKNDVFFVINGTTISYPDKKPDGSDQLGNDLPFITCTANPADMVFVHCGESNIVINDDVKGKDRLIMSYGYYTAGSGPRTMYQVLEKVVD